MLTLRFTRMVAAVFVLLGAVPLHAADAPNLDEIERGIGREPRYTSKEPLFGLYVFGPKAATRVWAVLDKTDERSEVYDVLYFDLNANGDLTEKGERFAGKVNGSGADATVEFSIGSFTDPSTKDTHTKLSISTRGGERARVFLRVKWKRKHHVRGGYATLPGPYTHFATKPKKAPVLWPGADGPFSFQEWIAIQGRKETELTIGASDDMKVFLGHAGSGPNTFCAVSDTFLPKDVPVVCTLIYRARSGKEERVRSRLKARC